MGIEEPSANVNVDDLCYLFDESVNSGLEILTLLTGLNNIVKQFDEVGEGVLVHRTDTC